MLKNLRQPRRVVITGLGCVTPLGVGREAFWGALAARRERRAPHRGLRRQRVRPCASRAQVPGFDWEAELNPKDRTPRRAHGAARARRRARGRRTTRGSSLQTSRSKSGAASASCSARAAAASPSPRRSTIPLHSRRARHRERLHHPFIDARRTLLRAVDGLRPARTLAHRLDRLHLLDRRHRLRRAAHRARPAGGDARGRRPTRRSRPASSPASV